MAIKLNKNTRASARDYVDAILAGCRAGKIKDALDAIENTDKYPRLMKYEMVEYSVGWIRGVADALGVTVPVLWAELVPATGARRAA